jgi:hypothetical protein
MPREVEEANALSLLKTVAEGDDAFMYGPPVGILPNDHFETRPAEDVCDSPSVIDRIAEASLLVVRVPDDKRDPPFLLLSGRVIQRHDN